MKKLINDSITIVDIGALGGVSDKWGAFTHNAILFEPNPNATFPPKENWLVINSALSDSAGERKLYITKRSSKSSFYSPNFDLINKFPNPTRFEIVNTVQVKTDTLDNQLLINNVSDVDIIKLDVQGHELPILRGAKHSLEKAIAVEIEVEFAPIYQDQPLFSEIDIFMRERGFELIKFLNLETWQNGDKDYLIWGDALYFKRLESLSPLKLERLNTAKKVLMHRPGPGFYKIIQVFFRKVKQKIKGILNILLSVKMVF